MRGKPVVVFLLCSAVLCSQSVSFEQPIRPFRINRALVADLEGSRDLRIDIAGRTLEGREVTLFSAVESSANRELPCYFYLDDSIQAVRLEVSSSTSEPAVFEVPIRLNPYRVTVFAEPQRQPISFLGLCLNQIINSSLDGSSNRNLHVIRNRHA